MKVSKEEFIKGVRREALRRRIAVYKKQQTAVEEAKIEAELEAEIVIPHVENPIDPFDV